MNPVAAAFLEKLLQKAERAHGRGETKPSTLPVSVSSWPEYFKQATRALKEEVNASLELAARHGAVELQWDTRSGERAHLARVTVTDPARLAEFLGRRLYWVVQAEAAAQLAPYRTTVPGVDRLLQAWCAMKTVRGFGPRDVGVLMQGIQALEHRREAQWADIAVRRASAELFCDSKVLESLAGVLDLLLMEEADSLPRQAEDVLSSLGLVKYPQPLLVTGRGSLDLVDGSHLDIPRPYVGVPPTAVVNADVRASYILSVENRTTFHEISELPVDRLGGWVLFLGGNPSPSMLRAYQAILRAAPSTTSLYHWGDCDLGGFRIAARFGSAARECGWSLRPWQMNPDQLAGNNSYRPMSSQEAAEIAKLAVRNEWGDIATAVRRCSECYEQEAQQIVLP